ncbi:hypothetical protein M405DRAFT_809672, partial [Rhizopogon salebrosus TDB-379]
TPQSETDALCNNVLATRTRSFLPWTCTRQCSRRIHWALLWDVYRNKILLVGGSQDETESL